MKILILYKPKSEHATRVEQFVRDYEKQDASRKIELLDADTVEAIEKAKIYDIVQYPAVIASRDSGEMVQYWQGENLPLMSELAYYNTQ
jgi:hypothetical protein